jgi:hypothetical protein
MHVVVDNYATHKHPAVQAWLAKNKRVTLHFPDAGLLCPTSSRSSSHHYTTGDPPRRLHPSVPDLIAGIRRYIDDLNNRCQPFTWAKTLLRATGGRRTSITEL